MSTHLSNLILFLGTSEPSNKKNSDDEEKNEKWKAHHESCMAKYQETCEVVMYGASNIQWYEDRWSGAFGKKCLNFGYGGYRIEHLLYRVAFGRIPKFVSLVVVHIGSNNIIRNSESANKIANGIVQVCRITYIIEEQMLVPRNNSSNYNVNTFK